MAQKREHIVGAVALRALGQILAVDAHTHCGLALHRACKVVGLRTAHDITHQKDAAKAAVGRGGVEKAFRQTLLGDEPFMVESRRHSVDIPLGYGRERNIDGGRGNPVVVESVATAACHSGTYK